MKPRRVILTVEVETDWSIKDLKDWFARHLEFAVIDVVQMQSNVIAGKKRNRK